MIALNQCQNKKFLVFGLGLSGTSTINALSKFGAKIECWDDNLELRKKAKSKFILNSNWFDNYYDFIVISPGINIYKHKYKNFFLKYKNRIITDLDLFYSSLKSKNVIVVTGTNGKSTLTKLIYDLLKKSNKKAYIGGNYGKAVLDLPFEDKKAIFVLELSSYQIDYSKNIYSSVAIMLTISPDHLERHETIEKYISTKLKIFDTLVAAGQGFIDLNTNFKSKILRMVKKNKYKNILYIKKNTKLFVNKKLISLSLLGNHLIQKYLGGMRSGKFHGYGTVTFTDGKKYVGEWKDDKLHGQGIFTTSDGKRLEGIFEENKFIREAKVNLPSLNTNSANNAERNHLELERQRLTNERLRLDEDIRRREQAKQFSRNSISVSVTQPD